jgi:putative ABC transport system permease protein
MRADLIQALRSLCQAKGYGAAVVLTLAIGLGANAVIASAVWAVLLRPLPFRAAERLVWVGHADDKRGTVRVFSPQDFDDLASATGGRGGAFASLTDYSWFPGTAGMNLTGTGEPLRVPAANVAGSFFPTLGIAAAIGRPLLPADDRPGSNHVVLLSYRLWRGRFAGDRSVVGRAVTLDGSPFTVVGVMPPEMAFPAREVGIWAPLTLVREDQVPHRRDVPWLEVIGRLAPGVSPRSAATQAATVFSHLALQFPDGHEGWGAAAVQPLAEKVVGEVRPLLQVLAGAVGMVLLVICVNLANLSLARAVSRRRELAIRAALGATPGRLMRQLLVESSLLALAGGSVGLLLARLGIARLVTSATDYLPRVDEIRLDLAVALFTLALAAGCGFAFGLAAARRATRQRLRDTLQEGGGAAHGGRGGAGRALVAVETALATLLLVGAGLLLRSFWRLSEVDPGFQTAHVLSLSISIPDSFALGRDGGAAYRGEILRRLRALPGVVAVAAGHDQPLGHGGESHRLMRVGSPDTAPISPEGGLLLISSGYFHTLGIPLRGGHDFDARDDDGRAGPELIISQSLARQLWPGQNAVGRRVRFDDTEMAVIGVAGDVHSNGLAKPGMPAVYASLRANSRATVKLFLRTAGSPLNTIAAARQAIWQVNPDQPISEAAPLSSLVAADVARPRLLSSLTAGFGALAALLAALGIYGVTTQSVRWRTQEIGVRMALGADRARVYRLVLREAMVLALGGLAVGLAAAYALARLLAGLLFVVQATDVPTYAGVAMLVVMAALFASYLPAREASELEPLEAIKSA